MYKIFFLINGKVSLVRMNNNNKVTGSDNPSLLVINLMSIKKRIFVKSSLSLSNLSSSYIHSLSKY